VRVVSATNADLPAMIRAGTFREDLFYRLNVIELRLPPLAARPDILPLAMHFLGAASSCMPMRRQRCWRTVAGQCARTENVMSAPACWPAAT
jgi:transcriptional regulator with PAS, ATPase and Fis domain